MKKLLFVFLLVLCFSGMVLGQSTTVSGTVTDLGGQTWNNGTVQFIFVPTSGYSGPYNWTGGAFTGATLNGTLNGSGAYSVSVPSNTAITPSQTQWKIQVCSATYNPICFTQTQTITGATQTINPTPPAILIPPLPTASAYADSEVSPAIVGSHYYNLTLATDRVCQVVTAGSCTTWANSGSSSSTTSQGPVINVTNPAYAGGASASNGDNNAQFTAAVTAALASYVVGTGIPSVKTSAVNSTASGTSVIVTIAIAPGDTVLVFATGGQTARTWTASDTGGNFYNNVTLDVANGGNGILRVLGTSPAGAKTAASSVTVNMSGGAAAFGAIVVTLNNVGTYRPYIGVVIANGTTATQTNSTSVSNAMLISGFSWFNSATISATQNTGILQQTYPGSASVSGGAVVTQAQATAGTSTSNTINLSATSPSAGITIELLGITNALPTLYFPSGLYAYSGGLNLTLAMTVKCDPGAELYYTGTAHAMDIGIAAANQTTAPQPYYIDGCWFTGGQNMTQGIFLQPFTEYVGIRNCTFWNFGNGTAFAVAGSNNNWDIEIGPQNRFYTDDFVPRNFINSATQGVNNLSYVRVHDNSLFCIQGRQGNGCSSAQSGIGVVMSGENSRVYLNNIAFLNPLIQVSCAPGFTSCMGNQIDQNQLEGPVGGDVPLISYGVNAGPGSAVGLLVTQNTIRTHSATVSPIASVTGTTLLNGARINFNTMTNLPAANPVVQQNNLAGQTGNQAYANTCSIILVPTSLAPCPLMHTQAGNISAWSGDVWLGCTMVAGTCTATFQTTYGIAPRCTATWNGTGTLTGILKAVPSTTNVVVTSSVGTDTDAVNIQCSAADAQ